MDFGEWLDTVQFYETLLTFHEKVLGKKKDAFLEKKNIQKCKNCNPQEHVELRKTLYLRTNENDFFHPGTGII